MEPRALARGAGLRSRRRSQTTGRRRSAYCIEGGLSSRPRAARRSGGGGATRGGARAAGGMAASPARARAADAAESVARPSARPPRRRGSSPTRHTRLHVLAVSQVESLPGAGATRGVRRRRRWKRTASQPLASHASRSSRWPRGCGARGVGVSRGIAARSARTPSYRARARAGTPGAGQTRGGGGRVPRRQPRSIRPTPRSAGDSGSSACPSIGGVALFAIKARVSSRGPGSPVVDLGDPRSRRTRRGPRAGARVRADGVPRASAAHAGSRSPCGKGLRVDHVDHALAWVFGGGPRRLAARAVGSLRFARQRRRRRPRRLVFLAIAVALVAVAVHYSSTTPILSGARQKAALLVPKAAALSGQASAVVSNRGGVAAS